MNQKLSRCQCGRDPLLKWQAGGFGRVPSWRIDCVCGATISEIVARQTYASQQQAKTRIIKRWNKMNPEEET